EPPELRKNHVEPELGGLPVFERYKLVVKLIRYGMSLSRVEFKILLFVFDRTIAYNKKTEAIPYSHFLKGIIRKKDGLMQSFPCGIGETALKRGLRRLVEAGALRRHKS